MRDHPHSTKLLFSRYSVWLFTLACCPLLAQQDTSQLKAYELPEVTVGADLQWTPSSANLTWSKEQLATAQTSDLASLLNQQSGLFIKSYGLGSLATTSIRGASASQMVVLWNGLPIDNPMLGLLDVSQLNLDYFGSISLRQGGQSVGFGSGAIGGSLQLDSDGMPTETGVSLTAQSGAMGLAAGNATCYFVSQNKKWGYRTTFSHLQSRNDFRYFDLRRDAWTRQPHARLRQSGFQQEIFYQPNEQSSLSLRIWGQEYDKKIPPTTTQRVAESSQQDAFLRVAMHYRRQTSRRALNVRSGWFRERIVFADPRNGIRARSDFTKLPLELSQAWEALGQLRLTAGLSSQFIRAEAPAYGQPQHQLRVAPFLLLSQENLTWNWQLSARQETVDAQLAAWSPAAQLGFRLSDGLTATAKLSRDFRLPTLNDLFWQPGGNPEILPESGWSQELGFTATGSNQLEGSLTLYHRLLNNWILWSPDPDMGYWRADNLIRVRSYGWQGRGRSVWDKGPLVMSLELAATYVRSLNLVAVQLPRLAANRQLAYTPEWSANGRLGLEYRSFSLHYNQQYVGRRFANDDTQLSAYWPARLTAAIDWQRPQGQIQFGLNIENLWNLDYRVLQDRRMPGRYIQGRIRYQWRKAS